MNSTILALFFCMITCLTWNRSEGLFLQTRYRTPTPWVNTGRAFPDEMMNFYLLLEQSNVDVLQHELFLISNPKLPDFSRELSTSQIMEILRGNKDNTRWLQWLNRFGNYCHDMGDVIECNMPVEIVEKLFRVSVNYFENQETFDTHLSVYQNFLYLPEKLENDLDFTLGLFDFPQSRKTSKTSSNSVAKPNVPSPDSGAITPEGIRSLYGITDEILSELKSYSGNKATQAVAEFQNDACYSQSDLVAFCVLVNITCHPVTFVVGYCNPDNPAGETEATLDIQYQMGVGNVGTTQQYIEEKHWLYAEAVSVFNLVSPPRVISKSWGWWEQDNCDPGVFGNTCVLSVPPEVYVKRVNTEFLKLALRRVTLCASSGDSGADGRTNTQCTSNFPLRAVFPADSPYVLAVGATYVHNATHGGKSKYCKNNSCIMSGEEYTVVSDAVGWCAGGGVSEYFGRPVWQYNASTHYWKSNVTKPSPQDYYPMGRMYPDVTAVGHNYLIVDGNSTTFVDGTSASSPTWSGLISLLNVLRLQQRKSVIGLAGPLIYQMAHDCPDCFTDGIHGCNNSTEGGDCPAGYGYCATQGFDPVYGWGSPRFDKIYQYVKNLPY